ncbi:CRBN family protein [Megaselia abdita]
MLRFCFALETNQDDPSNTNTSDQPDTIEDDLNIADEEVEPSSSSNTRDQITSAVSRLISIRNSIQEMREQLDIIPADDSDSDDDNEDTLPIFRNFNILNTVRNYQIGRIRDTLRSINERYRGSSGEAENADFEDEEVLNFSDSYTTEDSLHTSDVETVESMDDEPDVEDYDENLTGEHKYLEEMERVPGCGYLEPDKYYKMKIIALKKMIYPGEVVPMVASRVLFDASGGEDGVLFGIICNAINSVNQQDWFGVTCQVFERNDRGSIKARSLQRFVINIRENPGIQEIFLMRNPYVATIKILAEVCLPDPLLSLDMGSMNRFKDSSHKAYVKNLIASTTPWPTHVYRKHNLDLIISKARQCLIDMKIKNPPTDPVQLSFWLARNIILCEPQRLEVFQTNSVNERFNMLNKYMDETRVFDCIKCARQIAKCKESFAMSVYGVQQNYCNPGGFIHETTTVYKVDRNAVRIIGSPNGEFSWFPGYDWQILSCTSCHSHLGWKFTIGKDNPKLRPKHFFGISGSCIKVSDFKEKPRKTARSMEVEQDPN